MCDPILTSRLSQKGCAMMMWLLTGSRPDTSISSCRAKTYKKLCEKMIVAQVRHKRCVGDGKYQEMVQKLCKNNLTDESLMVIAMPLGFEASWLEKAKTARKQPQPGFGQATLSMASQQRQYQPGNRERPIRCRPVRYRKPVQHLFAFLTIAPLTKAELATRLALCIR